MSIPILRPFAPARSGFTARRRRLLAPLVLILSALGSAVGPGQQETVPPLSPLAGAIYFDPWQLEKEIIVTPLVLQEWLDLGLTSASRLDAGQRDALKPIIGDFLGKRCPVFIGGEEIDFTLDRLHFIEPNDKEFVVIDDEAVVAVSAVRISAVFAAPNTDPDLPLQLLWNLFPEGLPHVPVTVADAAGSRLFKVTRGTPTVSTEGRYEHDARLTPKPPPAPARATLALPWLTILLILGAVPVLLRLARNGRPRLGPLLLLLALAGAAATARKAATVTIPHPFDKSHAPSPEQSAVVLDRLLRQVYHAFDYRDQSEQYDVLAEAVGGDALTEIFLEVQRTLESRQRDGARVRVNDLRIEAANPTALDDRRGFEAACTWEVRGRVGHWGHFHDRTNRYQATFVVEPIEDAWKITGLTLHARHRETNPAP